MPPGRCRRERTPRRSGLAPATAACIWALAGLGCADPCPQVPVRLPVASVTAPWAGPGYAVTEVRLGDRRVAMLLDTGYPRSAIAAAEADGLDARNETLEFAGLRAGPAPLDLILGGVAVGGVVGSDVLHQVPLVLDARARTVEVLPAFRALASEAVLGVADAAKCTGGVAERRAPLFFVRGDLEGEPLAWLVDTGAESTFAGSGALPALSGRPQLGGLRISSGFAGTFTATATRARRASVGPAQVENLAVLASPEVDAELARISDAVGAAWTCAAGASCGEAPRFGGFLGWNFLREFKVSLAEKSAAGDRRLGLERFDTQDHVRRDFVGVGIITSASAAPPGLRIEAFLSRSPARDSGVLVGDVITAVDGQPATSAPSPFAAAGTTVALTLQRAAAQLDLQVTVADLLPNPPPP